MATVPTPISGSARGISQTLAGFVIQSATVDESPIAEQVPDQNGAIADEIVYDTRYDLTITVISSSSATTAPTITSNTFVFDSKNWRLDKISDAGTYNGLRKWTITAHRYVNFPAQS